MTRAVPQVVTTTGDLQRALDLAASDGRLALDTEFMRERTYRARLCLVQIAAADEVAVVDPLEDVDLRPLAQALSDPGIRIIVHAGKQDLEIFHDMFEVVPTNVFDVQIAAAFAGLGSSLPYARVVESLTGTTLVKGESYTEWCQRPLTDSQLTYAADDVRYLPAVADALDAKLAELGRTQWVAEEMRALEDEDSYGANPTGAWKRVSGRGSLSSAQLAVLRELAAWREEAARERDLPRGWIVKDPTLVELARRSPKAADQLQKIRGLSQGEIGRSGSAIVQAIARGKKAAPVERTAMPPRSIQVRTRAIAGLADAVLRARCERAGIAPESVATRAELEALIADAITGKEDPKAHPLLTGWRRELAGLAIVAVARGKMMVKATDNPPFIEEIET
ncbi:MAG: ribonuclease [Actinomycetota bacterium]|nr:ribonuclease [Actinomycetota bacterium]